MNSRGAIKVECALSGAAVDDRRMARGRIMNVRAGEIVLIVAIHAAGDRVRARVVAVDGGAVVINSLGISAAGRLQLASARGARPRA